jgi:hypothetical protein
MKLKDLIAQLTAVYMNNPDAELELIVLRDAYSVTDSIELRTVQGDTYNKYSIFLGKIYNERRRTPVHKVYK